MGRRVTGSWDLWPTRALLAGAVAAGALLAPPTRAATRAPEVGGTGTLELRLLNGSNLISGDRLAVEAAPGFGYATSSHETWLNLGAGAAYFVAPAFALGIDASYTRAWERRDTAYLWNVAPFAKVVTGLSERAVGFFAEASPGWLTWRGAGAARESYLTLGLWSGLQVPIGESFALQCGLTGTLLVPLTDGSKGTALLGERVGISAYLPPLGAGRPRAGRHGKGTVELRFQTSTGVAAGGVAAPPVAHGARYDTRSEVALLELAAGAGVFVSPFIDVGGELMTTLVPREDPSREYQSYGTALFVRLVSGVRAWQPGLFLELSPALLNQHVGNLEAFASQLNAWAGAHVPVGPDAAVVVGPSISRIDDLAKSARGVTIVGARLGLSLYTQSIRPGH